MSWVRSSPQHFVEYDYVMTAREFTSTHKSTGKKVYFTIYEGTRGALRAIPVQICYQPNWWFLVVLNLRPENAAGRF